MSFTYAYPRPAVTVDCILLSRNGKSWEVLCIKRAHDPCKGQWAFPGGFVDLNEDLADAIHREMQEETGLAGLNLRQFMTVGTPGRDPRGHTISVIYLAVVNKEDLLIRAGSDAAQASWFAYENLPQLAFDHAEILKQAIEETRRIHG